MGDENWHDLGPVEAFAGRALTEVKVGKAALAVSSSGGTFGVVSGVCNHAGGPLGNGRLDGEYIVCPWHNWKYHRVTGEGEPGSEEDRVPRHDVRIENGHLLVNLEAATKRNKAPHPPHPLERPLVREAGPVRIAGISTTNMDTGNPATDVGRCWTSRSSTQRRTWASQRSLCACAT
jgi:nitrite reductase/ring-hydroxylating ferredoxin subunit